MTLLLLFNNNQNPACHSLEWGGTQLYWGSNSLWWCGGYGPPVNVTASQTLATLSESASAIAIIAATSSQTLGSISNSASVTSIASVSSAQTLDNATQSATDIAIASVSGSQTLDSLTQTAEGTVTGSGTVEPEVPQGHSAGYSAWYYRKLAAKRKKKLDDERERQLAIRYAQRIATALEDARAASAAELAAASARLERLIAESDFNFAYLLDTAERLVTAAVEAARAENERVRQEQMMIAAELARRIEDDLRDEEEAELLLLM